MDFLGRVPVPTPTRSTAPDVDLPIGAIMPVATAQFPLITDYLAGMTQDFPIITHRFGHLATLATQRYQVGIGNRRFQFQRGALSFKEQDALLAFYDGTQGAFQSFTYAVPNPDRVTFEIVR